MIWPERSHDYYLRTNPNPTADLSEPRMCACPDPWPEGFLIFFSLSKKRAWHYGEKKCDAKKIISSLPSRLAKANIRSRNITPTPQI